MLSVAIILEDFFLHDFPWLDHAPSHQTFRLVSSMKSVAIMLRNRYWSTTFQHYYSQRCWWMVAEVAGVISPSENLPSKARKLMCVGHMLLSRTELRWLSVLCSNSSVQHAVIGGDAVEVAGMSLHHIHIMAIKLAPPLSEKPCTRRAPSAEEGRELIWVSRRRK